MCIDNLTENVVRSINYHMASGIGPEEEDASQTTCFAVKYPDSRVLQPSFHPFQLQLRLRRRLLQPCFYGRHLKIFFDLICHGKSRINFLCRIAVIFPCNLSRCTGPHLGLQPRTEGVWSVPQKKSIAVLNSNNTSRDELSNEGGSLNLMANKLLPLPAHRQT